jgi:hypothetical protein
MRPWVISVACFLGIALGASTSAARCLAYEPTPVALEGKLTSRLVPGPPGYVSVARGDHPETIYILVLDAPVCVNGSPSNPMNSKSHARVTEVQLVDRGFSPARYLDKRVRVSGSFFGAHTRHHRTPIVLNVKGIRPMPENVTRGR